MKKILCILTLLLGNVVVHAGGPDYCEPVVIIQEKIVYVDRVQEVPIEISVPDKKKNRLSVLVLNGPDNNVSLTSTPTSATINHDDENAIGLLYQRDLGPLTLGVFGTSKDDVGVSLGINW